MAWFEPCCIVPCRLNLALAACQVYPIGIPILYAIILWSNRELLNPSIVRCKPETDSADESTTDSSAVLCATSKGRKVKNDYSPQELQELEERVQARKGHPALVPSMFLWKDFGESRRSCQTITCLLYTSPSPRD